MGREGVGHGDTEPAGQVVVAGAATGESGSGVGALGRAWGFGGFRGGDQIFDQTGDLRASQFDGSAPAERLRG
jgi:hypothetical protein